MPRPDSDPLDERGVVSRRARAVNPLRDPPFPKDVVRGRLKQLGTCSLYLQGFVHRQRALANNQMVPGEDPQSFANLLVLNAEFVQPADKAPRKAPKPFFVPLLKRCRVARSRT